MEQIKFFNYESPQLDIVEIFSEGVLCISGQTESYTQEDVNWGA